ncbi:trypsin-like peptidase domain-containing protein [Roseomonas sp. SSH11]|uniref:Trypsin-like peptidase domain-containing protein n=1 Tax=Pararoseomonas baculiformis TaxID=2820812 RepID=A0ABS4AIV4_9PROT|nr:serine protease [Pararoseomonas baculiformis]MBP0446455.1 trypsin-like peptidase domain-containing protein [Pararoseomonas baculiformis]
MRAPIAAILPALLLAATPAPAQLVYDPAKPPPAGGPAGGSRIQAQSPEGKPPPLYDMPDPAPRRPGPPSRPGTVPEARPQPAPPGPAGKPPPLDPDQAPAPRQREVSSGTGFIIGDRQALTNDHVVRGCRAVRARTAEGREVTATIRTRDSRRDLAILDLREAAGPALAFRAEPAIRRGDSVVTYGFPLAGMLASGPTLTTGDISALAGLADNRAHYQISAPVQPGNSGGPLLDLSGHVVGIITSKLNAQRVAQRTGDIPQNVNFAVKAEEALAFLRENGIRAQTAPSTAGRSAAEVGEAVHPSVLFLRCLG